MILVDTSVWITADNKPESAEGRELDSLLRRDEVAITDMVMAEVLQGAPTEAKFRQLADTMVHLHFFHAAPESWRRAAELSFNLRRNGFTTALSDLIIATVALENDLAIYAADSDFKRVPGLRLHEVTT